jgi:hypothetical protein
MAIEKRIPNNTDFTMEDVFQLFFVDPADGDLISCFDQSEPDFFDSNYTPSGFDPHASDKSGYSLMNFRNYGEHQIIDTSPDGYEANWDEGSFDVSIGISPPEVGWQVVDISDSWISVSKSSGSGPESITVYVDNFLDSGSRTGSIKIETTGYSPICTAIISVSQVDSNSSGDGGYHDEYDRNY